MTEDSKITTSLGLDLSGVSIGVAGLNAGMDRRLRDSWGAFVTLPPSEPLLDIQIEFVDADCGDSAYLPKAMASDLAADRAHFSMPEGEATVTPSGHAQVVLVTGTGDRAYFTMLNMMRACLAWLLPTRGGALIHAAGLVLDGRGFLLVGAEGAGKSTWARLGEQAGARVVSDDLVLVDGVGSQLELLGTPFRSTHVATYGKGRWPLAGVLFSRHGSPPAVRPVLSLLSQARITANLPFVADGIETDARINDFVARMVSEVPCAELTFAPDPGFVDVLRSWNGR